MEFERRGDRRLSTVVICTDCGLSHESGEEWNHGADWNRLRENHLADGSPEQKAFWLLMQFYVKPGDSNIRKHWEKYKELIQEKTND